MSKRIILDDFYVREGGCWSSRERGATLGEVRLIDGQLHYASYLFPRKFSMKDEVLWYELKSEYLPIAQSKREVLEPAPAKAEWERVTYNDSLVIDNGVLTMFLDGKWIKYPHPGLRFAEDNGVTVLQRCK